MNDATFLIKALPSSEHIRSFFHTYASVTHLAGTANDKAQAEWTRDKMIEFGIHDTVIETYYPLINYPIERRLAIVEGPSDLLYEAKLEETPIKETPLPYDEGNNENQPALPTFHAYSSNGNVTGPVVYVSYGRYADFQSLQAQGLNFTGTIALMRNGHGSLGLKIKAAEIHGCIGALLYSDPQDDGPVNKETDAGEPAEAYPNGPWRPATSVERGTVHLMNTLAGDPLTPGYAATVNATRIPMNESEALPQIPSLPISWSDAAPLLKATENHGIPTDESGVTYYSGPSKALVNLVNINEYTVTPIWNVIGRIPGAEEPERVVLIGNHRDAWGYGASDPSSGSAVMLELTRVLGVMLEQGWRPRRTILIASWDANEYGNIGSTEWVEDNREWLADVAVAYINVDSAVSGPHFRAKGSPLLHELMMDVADSVIDPSTSQSVLQAWEQHTADEDLIGLVDTASDYVAFQHFVGIPSLSLNFYGDAYGVHHSHYDTIHWMEHFGDPTYEYHRTMVKMWGLVTLRLSSEWLLPMRPLRYANELVRHATHLADIQGCLALPDLSAAVSALQDKAVRFEQKLKKYQHKIDTKKRYSNKLKRHVLESNERLAQFERAFIDPEGLPGRTWYKHVVFAPGLWDSQHVQVFPAVFEALQGNSPAYTRATEERVATFVHSALSVLRGQYDDFLDDDEDSQERSF
ncbi:hypothetical protein BX666DRAFT_1850197 [Dichotomocladium elegans]|nr:hypothetical protein BX666DRAFT_1850197 [Dichotomocladium elegans]